MSSCHHTRDAEDAVAAAEWSWGRRRILQSGGAAGAHVPPTVEEAVARRVGLGRRRSVDVKSAPHAKHTASQIS
jgi:hypothetical protein